MRDRERQTELQLEILLGKTKGESRLCSIPLSFPNGVDLSVILQTSYYNRGDRHTMCVNICVQENYAIFWQSTSQSGVNKGESIKTDISESIHIAPSIISIIFLIRAGERRT